MTKIKFTGGWRREYEAIVVKHGFVTGNPVGSYVALYRVRSDGRRLEHVGSIDIKPETDFEKEVLRLKHGLTRLDIYLRRKKIATEERLRRLRLYSAYFTPKVPLPLP